MSSSMSTLHKVPAICKVAGADLGGWIVWLATPLLGSISDSVFRKWLYHRLMHIKDDHHDDFRGISSHLRGHYFSKFLGGACLQTPEFRAYASNFKILGRSATGDKLMRNWCCRTHVLFVSLAYTKWFIV